MDKDLLPSEVIKKNSLFYSPESINEDSLQEKGGRWTLFSSNNIEKLDQWWREIQRLCNNGTLVAIKSSTAIDLEDCMMVCYTSNYENEKEVKKAADEIRKLIEYKFPMYYKAIIPLDEVNHDSRTTDVYLYVHTVEGEFFKKETNVLLPSDIYWKRLFSYFGVGGAARIRHTKNKSGKWTLYPFSEDLNKMDNRFMALQSLCDKDILTSVVSSTSSGHMQAGVIFCYTPDYADITEVKEAADEIRKLTDYGYAMFFTTGGKSTVSRSDFAKRENFKYMHTVNGQFYKKDKYLRWIAV